MLPIKKLDESQKWELALHKSLDILTHAVVALAITQGATLKSVAPERQYSYVRKTDIGQGLIRIEKFTFNILEDGTLQLIDYDAKDTE